MTIPEVLKRAIENGNWEDVCIVYTTLTGEEISPPKSDYSSCADLAKMEVKIPLERTPVEDKPVGRVGKKKRDTDDFIAPSKNKNTLRHAKGGKIPMRPEPMGNDHRNRFADNQTIAAKELVTKRPELGVASPIPRGSRSLLDIAPDTTGTISVVCSLCGGGFLEKEALAHGFSTDKEENVWKCDDCCTPSGRRRIRREQDS
jgi:hypothetical protein